MSDPQRTNTPPTDTSTVRVYDSNPSTTGTGNKSGAYDTPAGSARSGGPSMGMIIGIIVALLVIVFLLSQFVF